MHTIHVTKIIPSVTYYNRTIRWRSEERNRAKLTFVKLNKHRCLLRLGEAGETKRIFRAQVSARIHIVRCAVAMALCNSGLLVGRIVAPFAQSFAYSHLRSRHAPPEPASVGLNVYFAAYGFYVAGPRTGGHRLLRPDIRNWSGLLPELRRSTIARPLLQFSRENAHK